MELTLSGVSHRYGGAPVLDGIDLTVERGCITCLVGPSGCGKSTLLRLMGGLERPDAGEIRVRGAADFNAALVDMTAGEEAAEEMVRLIHGYVYTDREFEAAAPSIRNGAMRINEGAALNMASVEDQLEWFKSEGLIDGGIELSTLVDDSYVETTS